MTGILQGGLAMAAAAVSPIGFACTASGGEAIAPVTPEQACARVRTAVEQALGVPLTEDAADGPGVRVVLAFGTVVSKAEVTDLRGGGERRLPKMYESSADRSLGAGAVDALARAIGAALSGQ